MAKASCMWTQSRRRKARRVMPMEPRFQPEKYVENSFLIKHFMGKLLYLPTLSIPPMIPLLSITPTSLAITKAMVQAPWAVPPTKNLHFCQFRFFCGKKWCILVDFFHLTVTYIQYEVEKAVMKEATTWIYRS